MLLLYAACILAVTSIETEVIQHRKSLVAGEIVATSVIYRDEGNSLKQTENSEYHYWFNGGSLRVDYLSIVIEKGVRKKAFFRSVARQNGIYYSYHFDPNDVERSKNARIMDQHDAMLLAPHKQQLFDPRIIGMGFTPSLLQGTNQFYSFVGIEERLLEKQSSTIQNGLPIESVSFSPLEKQLCSMRISKTQGPSLIYGELTYDEGRYVMNSKLAKVPSMAKTTVWFPQEIEVLMYDSDSKLSGKEITTIQSATFNRPIEDDQFTLAKMDLLPGTPISDSRKKP